MRNSVSELVAALTEEGTLIKELKSLSQQEQSCLVSLDLEGLDQNQRKMEEAMDALARLSQRCRGLISAAGNELGLTEVTTLSPIISAVSEPERRALQEAQAQVREESQVLHSTLAVNQGILDDSLNVVQDSVSFFNRLFNPGDTYGNAGSLVTRRGGSRFVCKEV